MGHPITALREQFVKTLSGSELAKSRGLRHHSRARLKRAGSKTPNATSNSRTEARYEFLHKTHATQRNLSSPPTTLAIGGDSLMRLLLGSAG